MVMLKPQNPQKLSFFEDFKKLCVAHVYLFDACVVCCYPLQTVLSQIRADKMSVLSSIQRVKKQLNGILYIYR